MRQALAWRLPEPPPVHRQPIPGWLQGTRPLGPLQPLRCHHRGNQ